MIRILSQEKKAKTGLEKDFFKLTNNPAFGKTIENVTKSRDIKLITTEASRSYLVSETNYHATKFFTKNLLVAKMRKTPIFMNKPVYLGL